MNPCWKPGTKCSNTAGSYTCQCEAGFEKVGDDCQNINECVLNSHKCHSLAKCTDTIVRFMIGWLFLKLIFLSLSGSYRCDCIENFYGDGLTCQEQDNCSPGVCGRHGVCRTVAEGFVCQCYTGYSTPVGTNRIVLNFWLTQLDKVFLGIESSLCWWERVSDSTRVEALWIWNGL